MADIAQIGVAFDTSGLVKGEAALDNVARTSRTTGTALDGLQNEVNQTGAAFNNTSTSSNRYTQTSKTMANATNDNVARMRGFRGALQNTSFQMQDMIVQFQMGTAAAVVIGQQVPQLLGGFGALGAAIGVVVALGAATSRFFIDAGEEAKTTRDRIDDLVEAFEGLGQSTRLTMDDLSGLRDEFVNLSAASRELELATLATQMAVAVQLAGDRFSELSETAKTSLQDVSFAFMDGSKSSAEFALKLEDARNAFLFGVDNGEQYQRVLLDIISAYQEMGNVELAATLMEQLNAFREGQRTIEQTQNVIDILTGKVTVASEETKKLGSSIRDTSNATEEWLSTVRDTSSSLEDEIAQLELVNDLYTKQGKTLEEANDARELLATAQLLGIDLTDLEALGVAELVRRKQDLIDKIDEETEARRKADREREDAERKREQAEKDAEREAKRAEEAATRRYQRIADGAINAAMGAETLKDAFKEMAISIISDIIRMYAEEAMAKTMSESSGGGGGILGAIGGFDFGSIFGSVFSDGTPPIAPTTNPHTFANGGAFDHRGLIPFADGGVVNRPTVFPFANGTGLMGEAGPEAIMPLQRGADGKLGVASSGSGGMVNITIINESGGEVETRQNGPNIDVIISRAVAMDIGKGGPVYQKISKTFGLSPQITGRG